MKKPNKKDLFLNAIRRKPINALNEIRDRCLLLVMANEYLCERVFLYRMGIAVVTYAESLRGEIIALKKRFPGKFVHEIDTDKMIGDLKEFAETFKKGDKELRKKCLSGQLGREFEEKVNLLSRTIQEITELVEGGSVTYSTKDSFSGLFGWVRATLIWVWSSTTFIAKVMIFCFIIALFVFNVLLFTMDKEENYQKSIGRATAIIETQKQIVLEIENEKKAIAKQMEILKGADENVDYKTKLEILALNLKMEDLEQKQSKSMVEIDVQKKKVEESHKIVQTINQKNFWQRLFKM
ncbi:MAG: hypothetical protein EHM45_17575 [Desulfobacteraceae bacterium]|nr:MAG: hypothetical protein EHM45_17575 [Desulfobacteraceae bacterium]